MAAFCDLTLGFLLYRAGLGHLSLEGLDTAVLVTEWSVGGVWWLAVLWVGPGHWHALRGLQGLPQTSGV